MNAAILAALLAMATRGECLEADHYPTGIVDATYVLLGEDLSCAIPTTPEISPRTACDIAWTLADPTGLGDGIRCEIPEERQS